MADSGSAAASVPALVHGKGPWYALGRGLLTEAYRRITSSRASIAGQHDSASAQDADTGRGSSGGDSLRVTKSLRAWLQAGPEGEGGVWESAASSVQTMGWDRVWMFREVSATAEPQ